MVCSSAVPQEQEEARRKAARRGAVSEPAPAPPYTPETYLRAAEHALELLPCQHHSRLDSARLAAALRRAAQAPTHPANVELLDSLPLVVYVPLV